MPSRARHSLMADPRRSSWPDDPQRGRACVAPVVSIGALSRYDRPTPTLNGYDSLLE